MMRSAPITDWILGRKAIWATGVWWLLYAGVYRWNGQRHFSAYRQNPRLNPLVLRDRCPINYRHTLKGAVDYLFDFGLNTSVRLQYRTGAAQWKVFQSPEDTSFSLHRRATSTGTRASTIRRLG